MLCTRILRVADEYKAVPIMNFILFFNKFNLITSMKLTTLYCKSTR